jgi:outer membrane protein TolC
VLFLAAPVSSAWAQQGSEPPLPPPTKHTADAAPPAVAAPPVMTLGLGECLHLALGHHPRLAAARASLAAAQAGQQALENLRIPELLDHEIPIRRRQAALGVSAASAGLAQTEKEVAYAVERTYFTVLYAREQERIAAGVIERLSAIHKTTKEQLEKGGDVTASDVNRTTVYLRLTEAKRIQAAEGAKRALAALKEAIGLGPEGCLDVPPGTLPVTNFALCQGDVVAWALSRRGDLVRVNVFAR